MPKALRTQYDDLQDNYSLLGGLDCSDSKDMARQEFKDESDVNMILSRFGVTADSFNTKNPLYGETDYDIDLQQALAAIKTAKEVHHGLPLELRTIYPTWRSMLNGANTGDLQKDMNRLKEEAEKKVVPPEPAPKV